MYFVMLNHPNGHPIPIVDTNDNVVLYDSEDKAKNAGSDNPLGEAHGYEIYRWK